MVPYAGRPAFVPADDPYASLFARLR